SYYAIGLDNTTGLFHTIHEDDGGTHDLDDVSATVGSLTESKATRLCVLVSDTGVASATVGGIDSGDSDTYTFDNGEPVIPYLYFMHASDVADEVLLTEWEVSYQQATPF